MAAGMAKKTAIFKRNIIEHPVGLPASFPIFMLRNFLLFKP